MLTRSLFGGKFLGTTTVGERGQIVIPAEARREYGIEVGDKLLVFSRPHKKGLLLLRGELVTQLLAKTLNEVSTLEELLRLVSEEQEEQAEKGE